MKANSTKLALLWFQKSKKFGSNWENNDNLFFFKNSSFSQMILVDKNNSIPTDLFHLFSWNLESFLLKSDKTQKFFHYFVFKILLWRVRIQFWQPCQCFSAETTKTSRSMSQKTEKNTSSLLVEKSLVSLNGFSVHVQSSSVVVAPFFSWQLKNFLFEFFKNLKNFHFFFIRFLLRSRMQF